MNEVIVGVDQSDTARRAAVRAAEIATAIGKPLHLVMAVKSGTSRDIKSGGENYHVDWVTSSTQFLDDLAAALPVDVVTHAICDGGPAKAMCDEAVRLDASMIVVGNRRMQGATRVLGAIAADVARHASCDVLIANTTS